MAVLNPEKLTLPDGSSVGDRMRAFADALVKHGQRGIFVLIDKETGNATVTGHIPADNAELARILRAAADSMQPDSEEIKLPQYQ